MFRESICSSTGIATKSHGLCFCACSPCPRRVFDFESPYPKHKRTWLACAGWAGRMPTPAVEWQLGGAWNGNAGWCLSTGRAPALEDELSFPLLWGFLFSKVARTDYFSLRHRILGGGIFGVSRHRLGKVYSIVSAWQRGLLGSKEFRRLKVVYLCGFFITYYCHSYYLRLLKLKSSGKIVASAVCLIVPAALQASFRVKQCYLGLPPTISFSRCYCNGFVCPRCSLQARRTHNTAHTCWVESFSWGNSLYSASFHYGI